MQGYLILVKEQGGSPRLSSDVPQARPFSPCLSIPRQGVTLSGSVLIAPFRGWKESLNGASAVGSCYHGEHEFVLKYFFAQVAYVFVYCVWICDTVRLLFSEHRRQQRPGGGAQREACLAQPVRRGRGESVSGRRPEKLRTGMSSEPA